MITDHPDSPVYRIKDLAMDYAGRRVLEVDNLDIHNGEILAFVGPSGSGKSTLLRLLNFLEFPTQGSIEFDGQSFSTGVEIPLTFRRRVTTVFQRPMLLDRSIFDNVTFGLRLRGIRDAKGVVEEVLADVGLEKLAGQRARTLSGGEAQRVALARAMVINPQVLLLDEPTANLDPYNISMIEGIVRRLNEVRQTTLVLVTHNIFQAHRLAHRVGFLLDGKIVEVNRVDQFFNQPDDPRTHAFINGEMIY